MKPNTTQGNRTKEFQDFFTPKDIALELYEQSKGFLKPKPYVNKILEPAVGSGNLIWPFLESEFLVSITCIDIQQEYINHLKEEAKERGYKVHHQGILVISND